MRRLLGIIIGVTVAGFVLAGVFALLWWLFVIAAVVAVAGDPAP